MAEFLFYLLSAVALLGAAGVVLAKSPMISVLSLLSTFFALAVVYLLMGFQFVAAVQILVYAGAILVLFLFVIMLLDLGNMGTKIEFAEQLFRSRGAKLATALAAGLGLIAVSAVHQSAKVLDRTAVAPVPEQGYDRLQDIALALFSRHSLVFEATSLLLLATMVAVLGLAKRERGAKSSSAAQRAGTSPAVRAPTGDSNAASASTAARSLESSGRQA